MENGRLYMKHRGDGGSNNGGWRDRKLVGGVVEGNQRPGASTADIKGPLH